MKLLFLLTIIGLFLFIPLFNDNLIEAHSENQSSFFKINGDYSVEYPVSTASLPNFNLPKDLDNEIRLVNEQLGMEIDTSKLVESSEAIKNSTFIWDFGDGTTGKGLKNTHTYQKIGSYIVTINIRSPEAPQDQLFQSVLVNIVPDKNYQLPKAKIKINDLQSKDSLTDLIKVDFKNTINFSATESRSGSPIVSYYWDFGDGQSSDKTEIAHRYDAQIYQYFPVLRIRNADGFIADALIEIQGDELAPLTLQPTKKPWFNNPYLLLAGGVLILIVLIGKSLIKRQ